LPELERSSGARPSLGARSGDELLAEADGASLLLVGPGALDLAVAQARRSGRGAIRLRGATGLVFADGLVQWAAERGMAASQRREDAKDGGDVVLVCMATGATPDTPDEGRARHARATREGIDIDDALWRRLRAYGDRILIPSSDRSRQDAG
jgi:LDH2 family malate/lactate/ureidoglycolate dehydrogenase